MKFKIILINLSNFSLIYYVIYIYKISFTGVIIMVNCGKGEIC